jgi:hypothetical protein
MNIKQYKKLVQHMPRGATHYTDEYLKVTKTSIMFYDEENCEWECAGVGAVHSNMRSMEDIRLILGLMLKSNVFLQTLEMLAFPAEILKKDIEKLRL